MEDSSRFSSNAATSKPLATSSVSRTQAAMDSSLVVELPGLPVGDASAVPDRSPAVW